MPLVAQNWNVVIVGRWNPFILTPAGIARRVFGLPKGTPVEVQVPLDAIAPHRVRHQDLKVIAVADRQKLQLDIENTSYELLDEARSMGIRAIKDLPETPMLAAGYNVRFRTEHPTESHLGLLESAFDTRLSVVGLPIASRVLTDSLDWRQGHINIQITHDNQRLEISFNFHRSSEKAEDLLSWMREPMPDVRDQVTRILEQLRLVEEVRYESDK